MAWAVDAIARSCNVQKSGRVSISSTSSTKMCFIPVRAWNLVPGSRYSTGQMASVPGRGIRPPRVKRSTSLHAESHLEHHRLRFDETLPPSRRVQQCQASNQSTKSISTHQKTTSSVLNISRNVTVRGSRVPPVFMVEDTHGRTRKARRLPHVRRHQRDGLRCDR